MEITYGRTNGNKKGYKSKTIILQYSNGALITIGNKIVETFKEMLNKLSKYEKPQQPMLTVEQ